ncbi:sortase [Chloroflexus sp.]|uniref:sortase n=1 Tax=Chloroflexus sp. TaxID=1904827 RepID=UPI00298EE531|nr:sortase [Chloroflexus sp.]MDW8405869.1 sortase [Chloroflexus sp.]
MTTLPQRRSAIPRSSPTPVQCVSDYDLLQELLLHDLPGRRDPLRPAQLRSRAAHREQALRGFLRRTWVDRVLLIVEITLFVAMIAVFAYWLIDGYGRDWWRAWQGQAQPPATVASQPSRPSGPVAPPAAAPHLPALPFTAPEMAVEPPDYIAPQPRVQPLPETDPRPQRLRIPSIQLDTPIYEVFVVDGAWQVAEYAAGYHHGTALPGTVGNTVLSGHAGLRGAVFRDLPALRAGDEIFLEAGGWLYRYRVREMRNVWPTQVEVMDPTPSPVLTLITCTNWDTQRLIVIADLVDSRPLS